jgi:hypothetical protein
LFDVPAVATSDMMMVMILLIMGIFDFVTKEIFAKVKFSRDERYPCGKPV